VINAKRPIEGSPEFYRQRASEMLNKAGEAVSEEARTAYLQLAAYWQQLAQQLEEPNW